MGNDRKKPDFNKVLIWYILTNLNLLPEKVLFESLF